MTDMPVIQVQSIVIKKKGSVTHFRNVTNALASETIFDPILLVLKQNIYLITKCYPFAWQTYRIQNYSITARLMYVTRVTTHASFCHAYSC